MENKFKIGDKVYISDRSKYKEQGQGLDRGKKIIGIVGHSEFPDSYLYEVTWSNGRSLLYNDEDLELANIEPQYEIY